MSEWVRLDITSFTKTTNREKILKILKGAKVGQQSTSHIRGKWKSCSDFDYIFSPGWMLWDHRPLHEHRQKQKLHFHRHQTRRLWNQDSRLPRFWFRISLGSKIKFHLFRLLDYWGRLCSPTCRRTSSLNNNLPHSHFEQIFYIFSPPIFPHLGILPNIPPFYSIIVNCWTIQQVHFWLTKTPNPITYLTTIWENKMLIFLCMVYLFRRW